MDVQGVARRITVTGRVQGVGYRPFVYRQALTEHLGGWVRNAGGEVEIHVEGPTEAIARFEAALAVGAPPLARARIALSRPAAREGREDFSILESAASAVPEVHLPPDLFCCPQCLAELHDPSARRFGYAFTNCTQCGPRYTIIERLPYDRPNTSMAAFALCPECRAEYENPLDRRFHAQPLGCPVCGPRLSFSSDSGTITGGSALDAAIAILRAGRIVAVKGIGGYHLMCDPANDDAVKRLRHRKHRPDKPLAVLVPLGGADGLEAVSRYVQPTETEAAALLDQARPIVLVAKRRPQRLSPALAPGLSELGVFLPYSPEHTLLLEAFGGPLVATSGNVSGEPVITDNAEAEQRLRPVADAFLHHDRPIIRPADDAVMRVVGDKPRTIRLGRGIAPLEIDLPAPLDEPMLAVGGHMKSTIALGWGRRAVISPHIGDLESPRGREVFVRVVADLQALYGVTARRIVCDRHPGYASTRWAETQGLPLTRVQHHVAHASALAGEYPEIEDWLVFAWDGVGYGSDGTLWGGEGFAGGPGRWQRVASLRPFRVTGGDRVGREPWRSAAALMAEIGRPHAPGIAGADLLSAARAQGLGTATTSSVGRLFDAAASMLLGIDVASFEGQGPMLLESAAAGADEGITLPVQRDTDGIVRLDWAPLIDQLADASRPVAARAQAFHVSLADALVTQVAALSDGRAFQAIGLTGGVFQNRLLAERVIDTLQRQGMTVLMPARIPANDGGLAFGQLVEALFAGNDLKAVESQPG
ncbi:MAG: carbamoyltransferase HypF [Devosia sp.]|nr:carbamoyltransferase HypF [Devosia sp.]